MIPPSLGTSRAQPPAADKARPWRWAVVAACVLAVMGLALWAAWANVAPAPVRPAVMPTTDAQPAPSFTSPLEGLRLLRQDGHPLLAEALRGKTVLLNFAFTACSTTCPGTTQQLRQVQQALAEHGTHIEFVTVTVDPLSDTPEVLQRYAQNQGVDFDRWQWLTGDPVQVQRLIDNFGALQGERRNPEDHLTSLFLLDGFGRVIGRLSGAPVNVERTQRELLDVDRSLSARARSAQG